MPGKVEDITPQLESVGEAQVVLSSGDTILFTLEGTNHTVKPVSWTNESAIITINSAPFNITLRVGETREVDLTADNVNDIAITLVNLTLSQVTLNIAEVVPPAPAPTAPAPTKREKPPEPMLPVAGAVAPEQGPAVPAVSPIMALFAVIVAAGLYVGYSRRTKKVVPKQKRRR